MADAPHAAPPKPKSGLTGNRKTAVYVIGGLAAAFIVYKLYQSYKASAGTSTSTAATPTDTGSAGAGSSGPDLTPVEDLASSINGLTSVLGAGTGIDPFGAQSTTNPGDTTSPATINANTAPVAPAGQVAQPAASAPASIHSPAVLAAAQQIAYSAANPVMIQPHPGGATAPTGLYNAGQAVSVGAVAGAPKTDHPAVTKTVTPAPATHKATAVRTTQRGF